MKAISVFDATFFGLCLCIITASVARKIESKIAEIRQKELQGVPRMVFIFMYPLSRAIVVQNYWYWALFEEEGLHFMKIKRKVGKF